MALPYHGTTAAAVNHPSNHQQRPDDGSSESSTEEENKDCKYKYSWVTHDCRLQQPAEAPLARQQKAARITERNSESKYTHFGYNFVSSWSTTTKL